MNSLISIYHWLFAGIVFVFGGLIMLVITLLPFENFRYRAANVFCRVFLFSVGVNLVVEGRFPNDRSYIFMANHSSFIDPFVVAAILPGRFTGLMAVEMMHYPLWNWLVRRYQVIPLRRKDRSAAIESIGIAEQRLQTGFHVGILPEGTRTLDGKLGPLKKGGFHMAMNSKAPIQVLGIEGGFGFKPKTTWRLNPRKIVVRFGAVIEPKAYESLNIDQLMGLVHEQLIELSGEKSLA